MNNNLYKVILGFLSMTMLGTVSMTATAKTSDSGSNMVLESSTASTASTSNSASTDSSNETYFDDEHFESYYHDLKERILNDKDYSTPLIELYAFIGDHKASESQVEEILNDGFFTNHIDEFKKNGLVSKNYKLPASTKKINLDISTSDDSASMASSAASASGSASAASSGSSDNIDNSYADLSSSTESAIIDLISDNDKDNDYVHIPNTAKDKSLLGYVINGATYTDSPIMIVFMDAETGFADYGWKISGEVVNDFDDFDLSIEHDSSHIKINMTQTLPKPCSIWMYAGGNTGDKYNLYTDDGKFVETLVTGDDGYIRMDDVTKGADYKVQKESVSTEKSDVSGNSTGSAKYKNINIPDSTIIKVIVISCFTIAAICVTAFVSKLIKKKKR